MRLLAPHIANLCRTLNRSNGAFNAWLHQTKLKKKKTTKSKPNGTTTLLIKLCHFIFINVYAKKGLVVRLNHAPKKITNDECDKP